MDTIFSNKWKIITKWYTLLHITIAHKKTHCGEVPGHRCRKERNSAQTNHYKLSPPCLDTVPPPTLL